MKSNSLFAGWVIVIGCLLGCGDRDGETPSTGTLGDKTIASLEAALQQAKDDAVRAKEDAKRGEQLAEQAVLKAEELRIEVDHYRLTADVNASDLREAKERLEMEKAARRRAFAEMETRIQQLASDMSAADDEDPMTREAETALDEILNAIAKEGPPKPSGPPDAPDEGKIDNKDLQDFGSRLRKKFGLYLARELLGSYRKGQATTFFWKAKFDGTDDDVLIKLAIVQEGEELSIGFPTFE